MTRDEARSITLAARSTGAANATAEIREAAERGHLEREVHLIPGGDRLYPSPELREAATEVVNALEAAGFTVDRTSATTARVSWD